MAVVEVVLRLPDNGKDIERIRDKIMDVLYEAGYTRVEPVGVTLIEEDKPCTCC